MRVLWPSFTYICPRADHQSASPDLPASARRTPLRPPAVARVAVALVLSLTHARGASAQQPVSEILRFLVTNRSVRTDSFEQDRAAAEATSETIAQALRSSLSSLPVPSSSGAFVYRWNPELGTVVRTTSSFGPLLTERTVTGGRGTASVGVSIQHLRFTSLGGRALRDGSLVTTANRFTDEAGPFDVDRLSLAIDADVATLHGSVGVTDALEIAVAVPVVNLRVEGSRQNVYRGRTFTEASASARLVGLADIVTRAKYAFMDREGGGLSAAVEGRLPSGNRDDLLGAGSFAARVLLIGSAERGRLAAHANVGATVGGFVQEWSASTAGSVAVGDRLTVVGELIGRQLNRSGRVALVSAPHPTLIGVETLRLSAAGSSATLLTFAPGLKWNTGSTWVLLANVAVPLRRDGLTAPWSPFIGLDWSPAR